MLLLGAVHVCLRLLAPGPPDTFLCLWVLKYPIYHQTVRNANDLKNIVHFHTVFCQIALGSRQHP